MIMGFQKYSYSGPVYYCGRQQVSHIAPVFTMAKTVTEACRNIIFRIANGGEIQCYDIDRSRIIWEPINIVPLKGDYVEVTPIKETCDRCGNILTDSGHCPLCDYGDESLLDED